MAHPVNFGDISSHFGQFSRKKLPNFDEILSNFESENELFGASRLIQYSKLNWKCTTCTYSGRRTVFVAHRSGTDQYSKIMGHPRTLFLELLDRFINLELFINLEFWKILSLNSPRNIILALISISQWDARIRHVIIPTGWSNLTHPNLFNFSIFSWSHYHTTFPVRNMWHLWRTRNFLCVGVSLWL